MEKMNSFLSCFKNPTTRIEQLITQASSCCCESKIGNTLPQYTVKSSIAAAKELPWEVTVTKDPCFMKPLVAEVINFKELLLLMLEFDKTLKESTESSARNATYCLKLLKMACWAALRTSPWTQDVNWTYIRRSEDVLEVHRVRNSE